MRTPRKPETWSEREERLKLEAERARETIESEDAAIERLIGENIRLYGP